MLEHAIKELIDKYAAENRRCADRSAAKSKEGDRSAHAYFEGKRGVYGQVTIDLYEMLKSLE